METRARTVVYQGVFKKASQARGEGTIKQRGVTLLELAVALALTAIVSGGVRLAVTGLARHTLYGASRMLQADLRYVRDMAVVEGRRWGVTFDQAGGAYIITRQSPAATIKRITLPDGVKIEHVSEPFIGFLPRGTPTRALGIWLSKGKYWQRITVTVSGGRVEIKDMVVSTNGAIPPES
jgi:prepilin-type N-terminal cleavage/methylation domain-containing protein